MNINKIYLILGVLSFIVIFQAIFIIDHLSGDLRVTEQLPVEVRREIESQAIADLKNIDIERNKIADKKVFVWFEKKDNSFDYNFAEIEIWMEAIASVNIVDLKIGYNGLLVIDMDENKEGIQIGLGEAPKYLENNVSLENSRVNLVSEFENGFSGKLLLGTIKANKIDNYLRSELSISYIANSKEESYSIGFEDRSENILSESSKLVF